MLPEIGVMIGLYILTRLLSLITRKESRAESSVVRVFSSITIVVTVLIMLDLIFRGTTNMKL
jgi:hypothetical protein